jgi:hypothetical protein
VRDHLEAPIKSHPYKDWPEIFENVDDGDSILERGISS